jgi:predicted solute-binding protein
MVADQLESGAADIGIVPCGELDRLGLDLLPDTGIACTGAVRSILLISRVAPESVRTLAADTSSRTSVLLARIILAEQFDARPILIPHVPRLESMLQIADAALIIGDPALALDPVRLPYHVLDLGQQWLELTGLPMVFAVWAGRRRLLTEEVRRMFLSSCHSGLAHIDQIAAAAPQTHGIAADLAHRYLTRHIQFLLGPDHLRGLDVYRSRVAALQPVPSVPCLPR